MPLLVTLPGSEHLTARLVTKLNVTIAPIVCRRFPDGEVYLRYDVSLLDRDVILLCTLDRPDNKVLPLVYAAATARDLGAKSVGLVCPYLAYMRQDRRFQPGEAVTSSYFARLLSKEVDWLVTVDPHLHRRTTLSEVYSVPALVLHAMPLISEWIKEHVERPLIVGPDSESEQWVAAVARDANAPHIILEKIRHGDSDVEVSVPDVERWRGHTPVLVDDIISTAQTMITTVSHLASSAMRPPVCIGIHGIFARGANTRLRSAGATKIITLNTIYHESNAIDVTGLLADAIRDIGRIKHL